MSQADNLDVEALQKRIAELTNENKELKKQKKFGLVWEDKPDAQVLRVREEAPMLCEDTSKAVVTDQDTTNHILINGDNFHALTALRATHTGKVDVIYIDPPYNTGNKDFIYNDDFLDREDGYRHSKWLSFMEKRLSLASELMSEIGVIFVSIDDNEHARLKLLMDDVFGQENFIANVIWEGGKKNNSRFISVGHDYILTYGKNVTNLIATDTSWRIPKRGYEEALSEATKIFATDLVHESKNTAFKKYLRLEMSKGKIGDSVARYSFLDESTGEPFNPDRDLSAPGGNGAKYELLHPLTGKPCSIPSRGWGWSEVRMAEEIALGNVFFGDNESKIPRGKRFLREMSEEVFGSVFYKERSSGSEQVKAILGAKSFSFPKEVNTLSNLFRLVETSSSKYSIILDFFAGSGTTAHAVAELNKEDGGTRQCILVTDGGKTEVIGESSNNAKDGAVNIAEEITYERVRRVLTGKDWADGKEHEPLGGNLRYFKVEMEPTPHGTTESDQRLALEQYTIDYAKIATSIFNEVASRNELDDETLMTVDYKVYADEVESRYLVGVNSHDYILSEIEEWFEGLPESAEVIMVGKGLEEIEWVKKNSDRITVDDVLGRVIRSRKYVASKLPLI